MPTFFKKWIGLIGLSILISACGADSSQEEDASSSVSLRYDVSAILSQSLNADTSVARSQRIASPTEPTSEQILRGELSATAVGGSNDGEVEVFTWTIYLDEDTLTATSNSTLTLVPGNYDFELLVTKGNQQYAGYSNQTVADGNNDIAMIIKPIIGDVVSDVTIIDRLAYFKFAYDLDSIAALSAPGIGIQVDGSAEQIFAINTETGLSDVFVNIAAGSHTLLLKLYDAAVQVGKSVSAQETQTIVYGTDLTMNIVPLYSELQFILTEDGGDANLSINLPAEVINEVGGVDNLTANIALVGVKNPLQESALLFIEQADGSYQADIILNSLQYEEVSLNLTFTDTTTSDQIASCNNAWILGNQSQTLICSITLIRRAVITNNILAVLGLSVVNAAGEPVSGAVITDGNGENLGITGSGAYGTPGYLKLYLAAGEQQIIATVLASGQTQTGTVTLSPLDVENMSLELVDANPAIAGFTGDYAPANWALSGVAAHSMSETTLTANVGSGGGGVVAAITIPNTGTITFDWNMSVYSAGDYGDTIKYVINGTAYNLSTAGSAAGVATEIAVLAGDVFEFQTWGSTSSSSYSASFDNFSFTPGAPEPEPVTVNGFIGDYAVEAWNVQNFFSGPVTFTTTDIAIELVNAGDYVFPSITATGDSTISFSWEVTPYDARDLIQYRINGVVHSLGGAGNTSGVVTGINVSAGDAFGFYFQTSYEDGAPARIITIDNFSFTTNSVEPEPEPEPVTVNGFIGDYAVEAWNVQNFFSAPVTFTATDLVVDVPTSGDYVFPSITAISDSTIGFSWDMGPYNANLGFEYRINGVAHVLGGAGNASGVVTDINVSIGDVFGFYFNNGYDDGVSDYIVTIDNFNVTAREADPEPVFCEEC